jgi:hypothetical protein
MQQRRRGRAADVVIAAALESSLSRIATRSGLECAMMMLNARNANRKSTMEDYGVTNTRLNHHHHLDSVLMRDPCSPIRVSNFAPSPSADENKPVILFEACVVTWMLQEDFRQPRQRVARKTHTHTHT